MPDSETITELVQPSHRDSHRVQTYEIGNIITTIQDEIPQKEHIKN